MSSIIHVIYADLFLWNAVFYVVQLWCSDSACGGRYEAAADLLLISGCTNAALNLLLVIKFDMDVAGVGIATVISQLISCVLVLRCLHNTDSSLSDCIFQN